VATDLLSFSRPRRTGLHCDVVELLGVRIVTGELAPGEALTIGPAPSVNFNVSRTVAREAIKVLEAKGLVEARPKVGTRVLPRSQWNLFDPDILAWSLASGDAGRLYDEIHELRAIIEPRAASLAAERCTPAEGERLGELLLAMRAGALEYGAFVTADLDLHAEILNASHNELLAQLAGMIRLVLHACQRLSARDADVRGRSVDEHRSVVEAIVRRDAIEAAAATERLLSSAAKNLWNVLAAEASGPSVTLDEQTPPLEGPTI
jgi:GntR family galactonate operon transcriptional repressor